MIVGFHSNQLGLRGTEIALYDYAFYNQTILGNQSVILSDENSPMHHPDAIYKFGAKFPVRFYKDRSEIDAIAAEERIDVLYCIKAGFNDGLVSRRCKTVVHAVFKYNEPHGDVYAYVSEWLSKEMSAGTLPFVPHIVEIPSVDSSLRVELGIPEDAIVFGRYGGLDTFNISFVHDVVKKTAGENPNIYFLFLYTDQFCDARNNIRFLEGTSDTRRKVEFINTCDAMLHARESGETFGLSILEFSSRNKPVLTWTGSHEKSHYELLGRLGIYYSNAEELSQLLLNFRREPERNWNVIGQRFSPKEVMAQFSKVFLAP